MKKIQMLVLSLAIFFIATPTSFAMAASYDRVIVFGDSLSDIGNYSCAHEQQIPLPEFYWNGRFSNGPNYVDDLAKMMGVAIAPSCLGGTDYAVGDARARDVLTQLALMKSAHLQERASDLTILFVGANDVRAAIVEPDPKKGQKIIRNAVHKIGVALQVLQASGAKNVLVPNVPNLGLLPEVTSMEASMPGITAYATALTQQFNAELDKVLAQKRNGQMKITRVNTYDLLNTVAQNPSNYGLTNTTEPCFSGDEQTPGAVCATPSTYLFWDSVHPTTRVHEILADDVWSAITKP
ncbi:MAG: SGNH/GDSL hydrolase family protein [Minisyncoccota bacterium]